MGVGQKYLILVLHSLFGDGRQVWTKVNNIIVLNVFKSCYRSELMVLQILNVF